MTANPTRKGPTEHKRPGEKQEMAMTWLSRRLRRPATRQGKNGDESEDECETKEQFSPPRPQTAPAAGTHPTHQPPYPPCPVWTELPLARPLNKPPPRPPRPDSGVIRDVNAWLDASMIKPAPPLMAGIPYWREGAFSTGSGPSADVRYAVPIVRTPEENERPTTSHGQQIKSFCRRAKRMQVRMPSLLRTKSQRFTVQRKQTNRRSTSMPLLLSKPSNDISGSTPRRLARSRSLMHMTERSSPTTVSSQGGGWIRAGRAQYVGQSPRLGCPSGARFDDQESSMERRVNAVFGQTSRLGDHMRPPTTTARFAREDSVGNLSDAPTYTSGPPPPSYRSRAASVRTTSSFGCVDAMSSERRQQLSQEKMAPEERGVKGKFKKLAQKAHLTK